MLIPEKYKGLLEDLRMINMLEGKDISYKIEEKEFDFLIHLSTYQVRLPKSPSINTPASINIHQNNYRFLNQHIKKQFEDELLTQGIVVGKFGLNKVSFLLTQNATFYYLYSKLIDYNIIKENP